MITIRKADLKNLNKVWQNIRPRDYEELTLQGVTGFNVHSILEQEHVFCAFVKEKPVAIFAYEKAGKCIWLSFFGTPELEGVYKSFTKIAKMWTDRLKEITPQYRMCVLVWYKYNESKDWLRAIGFNQTSTKIMKSKEIFVVMEKE